MKLFITLLASAVALNGATYYVAKTGSDSNDGSSGSPFLTVQKGVNTAVAGDTVLVGVGTYSETVTTLNSGTVGNYIVIDGQNVATISKLNVSDDYVFVCNLRVKGYATAYGSMVSVNNGTDHCILSNNVVDANDALRVYGINMSSGTTKPFASDAPSYHLLISNTVQNVRATTMLNVSGNHNTIQGNTIKDGGTVDFMRLFGGTNLIVGNTFSNNYYVAGLGNHPDFVQTFGNNGNGSYGHIITGNRISGIEGGQITQLEANLMPEIGNWTFMNNVFEDIHLQASCSVADIRYYNNTFIRCNTVNGGHPLNFGSRYYDGTTVYDDSSGTNHAHGAQVKNNVFINCGDETTNKGWYYVSTALTNVAADYNYVSKNSWGAVDEDGLETSVGDAGGWSYWDWWEDNGINGGDPLMTSFATGDYSPTASSFLYLAGADLTSVVGGGTVDILGNARPSGSGWSIGAYQLPSGAEPEVPLTFASVDMASITGGSFTMGDTFAEGDAWELPTRTVSVGDFQLSKYELSNEDLTTLLNWAYDNGRVDITSSNIYLAGTSTILQRVDSPVGEIEFIDTEFSTRSGRGTFPAAFMSWYGAVAACNWLSEIQGLTPCYDLSSWTWTGTNGYRLPTEAEWEYAARSGAAGQRFPFGNTVDHTLAIYQADTNSYAYDLAAEDGYHPDWDTDLQKSAPVGTFPVSGGLYDMAGNVYEWVWDWYGSYSGAETTNPTGPASGSTKIIRGGSWKTGPNKLRVSNRYIGSVPSSTIYDAGFRVAIGALADPPEAPDTDAPTVTITGPTSASTYATATQAIVLSGTASDGVGVTSVVVALTGATTKTPTVSGTANWTSSTTLNAGVTLVTVTAYDAASNSSTDTLTVTYTPPDNSSGITAETVKIGAD